MSNEEKKEQLRAAYALNLWTVSVSQIIDYNDVNIMKQEYDTIMNNLNLERMPKDEALLDVIKEIMDEITSFLIDAGDSAFIEREYQHQVKNAIWSAVPNVGAIFAASNPIAMGVTLATQVGIGYMNYRRNKSEYELGYEKSKWEIQKNRMLHLNALQKQLFETAWRLADKYEFPDEYRLTSRQITEYNKALMESKPVKRYNSLESMKSFFSAYPVFWYQLGSTANSIYRSDIYRTDADIKERYKKRAVDAFYEYSKMNQFNLLRHDVLTSAWALEYLELLDLNSNNDSYGADQLIKTAERYSGNASDIAELCAFAYLRIGDEENAVRLFHNLVNADYNSVLNTQILSGLYIKAMRSPDKVKAEDAKVGYRELKNITASPQNILAIPDESMDLNNWKPDWSREENFNDFIEKQKEDESRKKVKNEEDRKQSRRFYQSPILVVNNKGDEKVADYFLDILNDNRRNIGDDLPYPSRMDMEEYKKNRQNIEQKGTHVIMLGDSKEAKNLYERTPIGQGRWNYHKLGMRFVSNKSKTKTVILIRQHKNQEINDLVALAKEVNKKHSVKIPEGVETITSFFEDVYRNFGMNDATEVVATILTSIVCSPLLIIGEVLKGVGNVGQGVKNAYSMKDLDFLRYSIAIYEYLERENALYPAANET